MQVSVESGDGLERTLKVQVPSAQVDEQVDQKLREMRGQVRLQGFRPGKVPMKVVEKRYGPRVRSEVLDEVVRTTYAEALEQESLRPAGTPDIQPLTVEPGKDLEYEARFEIVPDVTVSDIESIELDRPAVDIETADVDRILDRLRRQHAEYSEVDRPAAPGDRVTIDFDGKVDGEGFDGNSGEDVVVSLGEGEMPGPFEEELTGMQAGESKSIPYTFPEGFPDAAIAGREAEFSVTMKTVEAPELPEADESFAETLGIEGGVEALRERIAGSLERERDEAVRSRIRRQVMNALVERSEIMLPRTLVDQEIEQVREQTLEQMRQAGAAGDDPDLPADRFEEEAQRRVKLGLLVNEVVRANNIEIEPERMQAALQRVTAGHDQPQQVMQHYLQNREALQSLQLQVMEDQVVDWVLERAQVTDKPMSLDALTSGVEDEGNTEAEDGQESY